MAILHGRHFLSIAFKWLLPTSLFLTQSWKLVLQLPNARATIRHTLYQNCHREGALCYPPSNQALLALAQSQLAESSPSWKLLLFLQNYLTSHA